MFLLCCRGNQYEVPQSAIQALDITVRHSANMHPTAVPLARATFFPGPRTISRLEGGAEVPSPWTPCNFKSTCMHSLQFDCQNSNSLSTVLSLPLLFYLPLLRLPACLAMWTALCVLR